ncbi:MAG: hypothetical protein KDB68_07755 [Planctomycetes bacterium]|nr:hypothetical protein [Planctomycetota bacterium]
MRGTDNLVCGRGVIAATRRASLHSAPQAGICKADVGWAMHRMAANLCHAEQLKTNDEAALSSYLALWCLGG